jgi:hypothetical protein
MECRKLNLKAVFTVQYTFKEKSPGKRSWESTCVESTIEGLRKTTINTVIEIISSSDIRANDFPSARKNKQDTSMSAGSSTDVSFLTAISTSLLIDL